MQNQTEQPTHFIEVWKSKNSHTHIGFIKSIIGLKIATETTVQMYGRTIAVFLIYPKAANHANN